jgi:hypothetical protein
MPKYTKPKLPTARKGTSGQHSNLQKVNMSKTIKLAQEGVDDAWGTIPIDGIIPFSSSNKSEWKGKTEGQILENKVEELEGNGFDKKSARAFIAIMDQVQYRSIEDDGSKKTNTEVKKLKKEGWWVESDGGDYHCFYSADLQIRKFLNGIQI